jgi:DNA-binding Lrp family transcriptional regulator
MAVTPFHSKPAITEYRVLKRYGRLATFVEVKLHDTTEKALQAFNEAILGVREVEQCHMIAGPFDYLLKVRTRDIAAYRRL